MRYAVLALVLLLLGAFVYAADYSVNLTYNESDTLEIEVNESKSVLVAVTVEDIPSSVAKMYIDYHGDTSDRVFCAPSPVDVSGDADFTCVIPPGDALDDYIRFVALDSNGDVVSTDTKLTFRISYVEQWYDAKAVATVGSTISVGGHSVEVTKASFLYVNLRVDGSPVTAFVNDETEITDGFKVVYRGFDPDTEEVFLVFEAVYPITASVQTEERYIVAPRTVYYTPDSNDVLVPVYTSCSKIEYRVVGSEEWSTVDVTEDFEGVTVPVADRVYFRCGDKTVSVYLKEAPTIVKELNTEQLMSKCTSLGYIKESECPKQDCSSYCAAHGYVKVPPGYELVEKNQFDPVRAIFGLVILAVLALAFLHWRGYIELPFLRKSEEEKPAPLSQRDVEPAQDVG